MNLLAFETSSSTLSVALKKGKEPVQEKTVQGFLNHAENLMPVTDALLRKKKLSFDNLDAFLIGRGPGSFTGLRIGFTTLKGLTVIKPKKCFGALSLDLIAENIDLPEKSQLIICLDARRQKIYIRLYERRKNKWQPMGKPQTLSFAETLESFPQHVYLAGDALIRYQKDFEQQTQKQIEFLPQETWVPKASTLISLFENRDKKIKQLKKSSEFIPLYFRLSEAESLMNERLAERKSHRELDPERSEGTRIQSNNQIASPPSGARNDGIS